MEITAPLKMAKQRSGPYHTRVFLFCVLLSAHRGQFQPGVTPSARSHYPPPSSLAQGNFKSCESDFGIWLGKMASLTQFELSQDSPLKSAKGSWSLCLGFPSCTVLSAPQPVPPDTEVWVRTQAHGTQDLGPLFRLSCR